MATGPETGETEAATPEAFTEVAAALGAEEEERELLRWWWSTSPPWRDHAAGGEGERDRKLIQSCLPRVTRSPKSQSQ